MEFRVLGQLEVVRDGERVVLGSNRQRSVLALLLVHAGTVVSTDQILDELWGEALRSDRQGALWVHVSNLRSVLEPDRQPRSEGTVLLTRPPGYLVQVAPDDLDSWRFEALLREGRALLETDPGSASVALGEALALWRGRAYEEFAYESFAQAEIARLEELRLEAVELRLDADLRRGLSSEVVGELEGLVRLHPLRERLTALLMVALHRSGRRSEALRTYQRLRNHLTEELGIDPSAELQALEGRILAGDPRLDEGSGSGLTPGSRPARLAVRGYELRERIGGGGPGATYRAYQPTVGREVVVRVLGGDLADDPDFIRRFEARAEVVARLEHPHLLPLYDYWREPGAAYLVTPLPRGGTLEEVLAHGDLQAGDVARVARDVGSALAFAHRHGLVHGAVEAGSILLDDDGRAYLGGFGLPTEHATAEADVEAFAELVDRAASRLRGGTADRLDEVLRREGAVDRSARFPDAEALAQAVDDALREPELPGDAAPPERGIENPYKGLRAFEETDSEDFFGRERIVERVLTRIGAGGSAGRLVVLVGPSGSGKSSIVHAGVVPALRRGGVLGSDTWFVVDLTPGAHPFEALDAALRRVAVDPPADLAAELVADPAGLRRAVDRILPDDGSQLVLVIDQLEELFTHAPAGTAHAFLDAVAAAVAGSPSRVRVVATLRADFYDRPLAHRRFGELLRLGAEVVTPMSPEELGRAVDGPAERAGLRFDRTVLTEIVADVADRPGGLPLLQFALRDLVERRGGSTLDLDAYRSMGGVSGALVQRAEALYGDLDPAARAAARQVLLRLVSVGDDPTAPVTRRRVLRRDLDVLGHQAVDAVLEQFGRHRLLSFDRDPVTRGPTVEVAHEALLTEWGRLHGWVEERREDVRQHRRLADRAEEWARSGREDGYLLDGPLLDAALAWSSATDLGLNAVESDYLHASVRHRAEREAVEEDRRREAAHLRRTARSRTRLLVGVGSVGALIAAVAGFAIVQRSESERLAGELAAVADGRRLAAAAATTAGDDPQLAMLLALESLQRSAEAGIPALPEAEEALHWSVQAAGVAYPATDAAVTTRIGPNGLTGIFRLPLEDLVELVRGRLGRTFTDVECHRFAIERCEETGDGLASPADHGDRLLPAPPPASTAADRSTAWPALTGTTITVAGEGDVSPGLQALFARFEEATGIQAVYRRLDGSFRTQGSGAEPYDLLLLASARMAGTARAGGLVDLRAVMDVEDARRAWGDFLVEVGTVGDGWFGVPFELGPKGLVWYPPAAFASAGYAPPTTWAELQALTSRMVSDGRTPWCLGLDSGGLGAWPATDWVEGLVLRVGGVELYDQWTAHEIPFDDPRIAEAVRLFGDVVFAPELVGGTAQEVARRDALRAGDPMLEDPPGCWMTYAASYLPNLLPLGTTVGTDVAFFELPDIDAESEPALFGGLTMLAMRTDRPEVRALVRVMANPRAGPAWAASGGFPFVPAHAGFRSSDCASEVTPDATEAVWAELCRLATAAVAADRFRLDASDAMPREIGATATVSLGGTGAFLEAMDAYVQGGPSALEAALASVEAAWPG